MKLNWMKLKKYRILLLVLAAFLVLAAVFAGRLSWLSSRLDSQEMASRWAGETDLSFAQVSVFFPVDQPGSLDQVRSFRATLPDKLIAAGLEPTEENRLWADAYSTQTKLTAQTDYGEGEATVYAVGGDFFRFHPLKLVSGSYFTDEDFMDDLILLDEDMAWKLYGGMDLTGKAVTISGKLFTICGVVERETDFATELADTAGGRIYMSYSAYAALQGGETAPGFQYYELVMADPVQNFTRGTVTETFSEDTHVVVENSSRFTWERILGVLGDFGQRSMVKQGVAYPYWENAARLIEDHMALFLLLFILCIIPPCIAAVAFGIYWLIRGWKKLKSQIPVWIERRRERRYRGKHEAP